MARCKPVRIILLPGSPLPLRPGKPPEMAMRLTTFNDGGGGGIGLRAIM